MFRSAGRPVSVTRKRKILQYYAVLLTLSRVPKRAENHEGRPFRSGNNGARVKRRPKRAPGSYIKRNQIVDNYYSKLQINWFTYHGTAEHWWHVFDIFLPQVGQSVLSTDTVCVDQCWQPYGSDGGHERHLHPSYRDSSGQYNSYGTVHNYFTPGYHKTCSTGQRVTLSLLVIVLIAECVCYRRFANFKHCYRVAIPVVFRFAVVLR